MSFLAIALFVVVGCVCLINTSNLNLTEKEERLLYVMDDDSNDKSSDDIGNDYTEFNESKIDDPNSQFKEDFSEFESDFENDFDINNIKDNLNNITGEDITMDPQIIMANQELSDSCDDVDTKSMRDASLIQKEIYEKGKRAAKR